MTIISEVRLHKIRTIKTIAMYTSFMAHGLSTGLIGPSLLDLGLMTNCNIDQVSYILPGRSAGAVFGSIIVGIIYPYINFQLFVSLCMFGLAAVHVWIPFAKSYLSLVAAFVVSGIFGGFTTSGGNIHLMDLWGRENQPFFQCLHFTFGLGALIAPLIVRPFLLDLGDIDDYEERTSMSSVQTLTSLNNSATEVMQFGPEDIQLKYPCWIIAGMITVPAVLYLLLWKLHPKSNTHPSRLPVVAVIDASLEPEEIKETVERKQQEAEKSTQVTQQQLQEIRSTTSFRVSKYSVIFLMMCFMPIYYGIELTFGQYLATFAVKSDLHLAKVTGASMTSVYWTMFTFFRLSTAFYIDFLGVEKNIIMNVGFMIIANLILVPLGYRYESCLWLGSVIMGIGCSSIWASAFGFLEEYFTVDSKIGSLIVVSSSFGEFIFPVLISQYIKDYPNIFLYISLISTLSLALLFFMVVIICRLKLRITLITTKHSDTV